MIAVSSRDVIQMTDERFADLLDELNTKQSSMSLAVTLSICAAFAALLAMLSWGAIAAILGSALVFAAWLIGQRVDAHRRSAVVLYELTADAAQVYEAMTKAFDELAASAKKWHVDAGGAVRDLHTWKRNAGASHIVEKRPTEFGYALPRVLKTNITPPSMKVGKETVYFLPDLLLVVESGKVGAVGYDTLDIQWQDSRFIEEGSIPRDAVVVGRTWKHPNKNGGPDRRFANNRQLPICLYESFHLRSANGLNELLQVSTNGRTEPFAKALRSLAATLGRSANLAALPRL